jgi:hydrogenase/urease accessory protein HupE
LFSEHASGLSRDYEHRLRTLEITMFNRVTRLLPMLCLILVYLIVAAAAALAHDPGLSAVDLKPEGATLNVHLAFARADIETRISLDADRDGQVSVAELDAARPALEALGRDAIAPRVDGRPLVPAEIAVRADDSNAIQFDLRFDGAAGARLQLESRLIGQLALGHKQFLTVRGANGEARGARLLDARNNSYELDLAAIAERPSTFSGFLTLGIEHILIGFDHIAFLLALLLAGGSLREAAKIITSFTAAHSITLALATFNLVNLPASVVEPLIAVSIVYVGVENLLGRETRRRWLLTFGFGLIHGFGFASVLGELGVGASGGGAAVPLLAFNLGVEIGQIAIAALVLPVIWKLRERPRFVLRYAPAASVLITLAGGYWLIERTLF